MLYFGRSDDDNEMCVCCVVLCVVVLGWVVCGVDNDEHEQYSLR